MKLIKKYALSLIMLLIIIGILILLIPSEPNNKANEEDNIIRLGYKTHIGFLPLFVAIEKGYFDEQGLEVELIEFESTDLMVQALLSGEIDALTGINTLTAFAVEENSPGKLKIFTTQTYTTEFYADQILVNKDSEITKIKDLKNKKVALPPGSTFLKFFEIILAKNDLSLEDLEIIQLEPKLQLQALESENVDAILSLEPLGVIALNKGIAKSIEDAPFAKYIMNPFPIAVGVLQSDLIEENQEKTYKLIQATNKAIEYIELNPDDSKIILSKWTNIPVETSLKIHLNKFEKLEDADKEQMQKVIDLYYELDLLENKFEVTDMFYTG